MKRDKFAYMRPSAYVGILDAFMMWKCAALPMWKCGNMRDDGNTRDEIRNVKCERGFIGSLRERLI